MSADDGRHVYVADVLCLEGLDDLMSKVWAPGLCMVYTRYMWIPKGTVRLHSTKTGRG